MANYSGRREGFVYLTQWWNYFKIGMSIHPEERVKAFNVTMPVPQKLIHKIPTEDMYRAESYLHKLFAQKRVKHEWFMLTADDVKSIKKIKGFDLSELEGLHRSSKRRIPMHPDCNPQNLTPAPKFEFICSVCGDPVAGGRRYGKRRSMKLKAHIGCAIRSVTN
jgi:hypothetical protein